MGCAHQRRDIDIDTIFSSLHHIHSIDEGIRHVGSTEIQFGRPKPATKVETSGQWTAAFNLIVKVTSFLFPHRYDELRQCIVTTSKNFSQQSLPQSIPNCSNTTKQSNIKTDKGKTSCSLIDTNSLNITSPLLHLTALELKQRVEEIKEVRRRVESLEKNLISAIVSMEQTDVVWLLTNANREWHR